MAQARSVRAVGAGNNVDSSWAKRALLLASDGTPVMIYADKNTAGTVNGDHTGVGKIYVYTGTLDRATWTLRATITPTTALPTSGALVYTANLFADNSIGIAWVNGSDAIAYRKVTTGTWAVGAEETVGASVGGTSPKWNEIDLSVSAGGAVLVIGHYSHTSAGDYSGYRLFLRRTTPNTWAQVDAASINTASAHMALTHDVSCVWILGGSAGARNYAISYAGASSSSDAHGVKMKVGKVDEAAGSAVTGSTIVGTFAANDVTVASTTYKTWARRTFLFSSATNEVTYGIMSWYGGQKLHVGRFTYNGTTLATTVADTTSTGNATIYPNGITMCYGLGVLTFFHIGNKSGDQWITHYDAKISGGVVTFFGKHYWDDHVVSVPGSVYGGTGVNTGFARPEVGVINTVALAGGGGNSRTLYVVPLELPYNPWKVFPATGTTVDTAMPAIGVNPVDIEQNPQSGLKFVWQFAWDSAFTTNVVTYTQADSKFTDYPYVSGNTFTAWDELPLANALSQRNWYVHVAAIDIYGNQGAWNSTYSLFTVAHAPAAAPVSPINGQIVFYGAGNVLLSWSFSDPYDNDTQTAYQIIIERVDTGAVVTDTGKVSSAAQSASVAVAGALQDITLRWRIRVWDADDVVGVYSDDATFIASTPPTVTINSPDGVTPVATPNPTINFSVDTSGGRTITRYRVILSQGTTVVYDSAWVSGSWADLATISHVVPRPVLGNNQAYTVQVRVTDELDLDGRQSVAFGTVWTPPSAPTSQATNAGSYNTVGAGYVSVTWSDTGRDADWIKWNVYRKDDLIDPNSGSVLESGTFQLLSEVYDVIPAGYTYRDFYAPSGYRTTYQVTQVANRFGAEAESTLGAGMQVTPKSDGYWFIDPTQTDFTLAATKLSIVTSDSFIDEWEEEVIHLLGRGRYVDRGDHLGYSGTLNAQLRDDLTQSARQKRFKLETLKNNNVTLYLRNPFGDMFRVSVGNVQVDRLAGVGNSEFVDVQFQYLEVVE